MAGAGKKTFTAGEVLTASDVNNYLMDQSVMVFGGTAARSSAIPTPSTGMTTYRTDTKQLESYNGSAWTGMSGLQLVKTQTIGTGVSSVTVTGAFSATYDNYKIIVSGGTSSGGGNMAIKLGAATTGHNGVLTYTSFTGGATNIATNNNDGYFSYIGYALSSNLFVNFDLDSPFLAKPTKVFSQYATASTAGVYSGMHSGATSFTSFDLIASTGTVTGGTIFVYGYGMP